LSSASSTGAIDSTGIPVPKAAEYQEAAFFSGFVQGVYDSHETKGLICTSGVTLGDVGEVVVRRFEDWMKANSALPSQTCAYEVVSSILLKRFPCDPKTPAK
jgi:hypothetical protein